MKLTSRFCIVLYLNYQVNIVRCTVFWWFYGQTHIIKFVRNCLEQRNRFSEVWAWRTSYGHPFVSFHNLPFNSYLSVFLSFHCTQYFSFRSSLNFSVFTVNRIKEETKTAILIPNDNEKKSLIRIEGSPQGVAEAKAEILEMAKKLVSVGEKREFLW